MKQLALFGPPGSSGSDDPVGRQGLYDGRVHGWVAYDAVSVRSACGGITATEAVVNWEETGVAIAPKCVMCKRSKMTPEAFLVCLRPDPKAEDGTKEEWLCGRKKCYTAYNEEDDVKVLEVVDGIKIVKKELPAGQLRTGELLRGEGRTIWEVIDVRPGGADVKCIFGQVGRTAVWASSSAGARRVSREEFEQQRQTDAETRAKANDETPCDNCWPRMSEESNKADYGRDPKCPDHQVTEAVVKLAVAKTTRKRVEDSPADVARVLALRAEGKKYSEIESAMGWPDRHGNRAWKIVKQNGGK